MNRCMVWALRIYVALCVVACAAGIVYMAVHNGAGRCT